MTDPLGEALARWNSDAFYDDRDEMLADANVLAAAARNWHALTNSGVYIYVDAHKQLHATSGKFEWRVERWVNGPGRYAVVPVDALTVTAEEEKS